MSRAQGIYNQLAEVKDRLPTEVAVCFGFALPSSLGDGRRPGQSNGEEGDLPVDFSLDPSARGFVVSGNMGPVSSFSPSSAPSNSSLEVGEDVADSAGRRLSPESVLGEHEDILP